jgi:predicted ArsR family transcriptional regulator
MTHHDETALDEVAALADPTRRRIFAMVRGAREPLSREEVARAVGISRKLAAFHLEKLLDQGLLRSHYARPPGRSGPGAGRTAKYYGPADREIRVSIPERRYDLAGELLVNAVLDERPGETAAEAAHRVARERGIDLGEQERSRRRLGRVGPERALTVAGEVLDDLGFEPHGDGAGTVVLANCPFHRLAKSAPGLVCGMNQAFIAGMLEGIGTERVEAALTREPGMCCVTLRRSESG